MYMCACLQSAVAIPNSLPIAASPNDCQPTPINETCTATCEPGFTGAPTSTCVAYGKKLQKNKRWTWGEVVGHCTPIGGSELGPCCMTNA